MKKLIMAVLAGMLFTAVNAEAASLHGFWKTDGGKSLVEIHPCGETLCGRITWLKEPAYPADDAMAGKLKVDRENPDSALQGRPIVGLQIMRGFRVTGEQVWGDGTIYDPENGKTYKCRLTLAAPDRLEVRGYIGMALFGRTTVWNR